MSLIPPLPPRFSAALRDARTGNPRSRLTAAKVLSGANAPDHDEAAEALLELADDPDGSVRTAALEGLGHLRHAPALPLLVARFEDGDPRAREAAVIAASRVGGAEAEKALRTALGHRHPEVRFQAVAGYAELLGPQATPGLLPLLADSDPNVRANAACALGSVDARDAADELSALLSDSDANARREAALAMAALDDPRAVPVLREALGDPERAIAAALALGRLRARDARTDLARVAGRRFGSLHFRAAAGSALARLDDQRGIEALRAVLTAWRSDGRSFAAELVGEGGLTELAAELAALSRRPRGADLVVIARALGSLAATSSIARRALEELSSGKSEAAAEAAAALKSL